MLYYETLGPDTLRLLENLQSLPFLEQARLVGGTALASIKDIAAMKIYAIIGRGTKKDFIDMFFLLQRFSLEDILDFYVKKYPDGSLFMALKSLSYFDDAEGDPMPKMLEQVSWEQVKDAIGEAIRKLP